MRDLIKLAKRAALLAGQEILLYYHQIQSVDLKDDGSPVTLADRVANCVISDCLASSQIPIISEEGDVLQMNTESYWLVDPLDGTKEFIAGIDEFTINIALIKRSRPLLGVVFAPAMNDLFWGASGMHAERIQNGVSLVLKPQKRDINCKMTVSRFHDHPDVEIFASQNRIEHQVAIGSSLKYGLLAASEVDVYPRLVGSSEWDTAAGQAVLEAVGGQVLDWHTGQPLKYGKPGRRNPRILAIRSPYKRESFQLKTYENELL